MKAPIDDHEPEHRRPDTPRRGEEGPALDAVAETRRAPSTRPLTVSSAQRLQAAAGNRALSGMIAQRRAAAPGTSTMAPAPPGGQPALGHETDSTEANVPSLGTDAPPLQRQTDPGQHRPLPVQRLQRPPAASSPKFSSVKSDVKGKQKALSAHAPPMSKANAAQAAAKPPVDDKQAQGKAANAEKMNAAQPGTFDKAAFIAAVNKAISEQAPKNLDEADNFGDSGKADAVKGQVQGQVGRGKEQSAKQIETATKAAPDTSAAKEKSVTPLAQEPAPGNPGTPNPANAVPDKAPASATDFSAGPAQVDQQMASAQVTEEQLATSNEPEFTGALKEKRAGEQHAATAPGQVRAAENQTLTAAKAAAQGTAAVSIEGMRGEKAAANNAVGKGQQGAQSRDEQNRAQVTAKLQTVFDATQKDVEGILTGLDQKVDDAFSAGEKAARDAFTAEHKRRMDEYKDKRYSGITGKLKWVKDKFTGLPDEANQIFVTARQGYVARMQGVISNVADVIGGELNRAKQRIAAGRQQLQAEVQKLPADLQAVGKEAAGEFAGKFDELTANVDAKGQELVQTLASKYNDALKSIDAEIEAEKEKNKGLIAKAVDAVQGVIDTIMKLKDLLLGVLAKAAQAVMAILKDPIGFLGNLVSAVGAGLKAFLTNIGNHVKKGLIGWLLGAMSGAGLDIPAKFDLRGILSMIASLLGLTWAAIRGRILQKGIPEQAMSAVEAGVPIIAKLQSEGVAGVTEEIKEKVGDLKENLLGKISEYLIPTVLVAGITWIISLLNPASAFIKACKMIIDIVTFIVERGAQIIEFVNAVLDAVIAIAGGGAGGVPGLIEGALAKSIPVLIGALAAILGVGGIANKVKSFFQALSKPVMKAVDWIVGKIVALGKKIWAKLKAAGKKIKDKVTGKDKNGKGPGKDDPQTPEKDVAPVSKPFAMERMPHTLTGSIVGGRVQVVMASAPGDLIAKAKTARTAQHEAGNEPATKALDGFLGKYEPALARLEKSKSAKKQEKLTSLLKAMADDLAVIGNAFDLKDLTADAAGLKMEEIQKAMPARLGAFIADVHELWLLRYILRVPVGPGEGAAPLWERADLAGTDTDAREFAMKPEFIEPLLKYFTPGGGQRVDTNKFFDYAFKKGGRDAILNKLGTPVPEALKAKGLARASGLEDSDYKKALLKQLNELGRSAYNSVVTPYGQLALPKVREGEHSDFAPVEINSVTHGNVTTTTYKTKAGKSFTVIENVTPGSESLTVEGDDLRLKTGGGPRGVTHDSPGFVPGMFLNRAHGVGDRFGGSGFAIGRNIVSTSDEYNKISQGNQERAIATQMATFAKRCGKPVTDVALKLTVTVHFGELMTTLEDRIKAQSWFKAGDADAERRLKAIMTILLDPPVRVVRETVYSYSLTCGTQTQAVQTLRAGSDKWVFIEKKATTSGP